MYRHALAVALLAGVLATPLSFGQTAGHLGMHRVADGVYVYTDGDPAGKDPQTTSSLVVVTPEGVLVGDGQGTDAATKKMLAAIRQLTPQPIRYLVNASWHPDHTVGNHLFTGATLVAHRAARQDLLDSYRTNPAVVPAAPTVVYDRSMSIFLGGKEIRLEFHGRAHTRGDTVIYIPADGVVFLSEIFFNPKQFPGLRSGYVTEWIATLKDVSNLQGDIWIPGHGIIENEGRMRPHLLTMREDLITMRAEIQALVNQGLDLEQIRQRSPLKKFATLINAERNLPIAIDRIYKDLKGELDKAR